MAQFPPQPQNRRITLLDRQYIPTKTLTIAIVNPKFFWRSMQQKLELNTLKI
jgi:hypothetical protein